MSQRYLGGIITANPTAPTMASASGVWTLEQQLQYSQSIQPKVIPKSVRLRASASAYLNRTPASAGNRITWTWSGWIKLGSGLLIYPLDAGAGTGIGVDVERIQIGTGNGVYWQRAIIQTSTTYQFQSSAVFRDPSAWYHLVLVWDSSNATSTERMRAYVNGVRLTTSAYTAPSQNQNSLVNASTPHKINRSDDTSSSYGDGYLTEVNFIDGQALTPSSFGAYDSNGVWQPITYTGTYGTNGFYLNFTDNSAATAAAIGKDYSGNGNNWTPNNISVTAGTTYDSMLDSPTNFDDGGTGVGNYAVLNPIGVPFANGTVTEGNLKFAGLTTTDKGVAATISIFSGTFYWETTQLTNSGASNCYAGVILTGASSDVNANRVYVRGDGVVYKYGTSLGVVFPTFTNNDVIGLAYDRANNTLALYKNGTLGYTVTGLNSADHTPWVGGYTTTDTLAANFGQRPFSYTPPTGFKALNTQNLALAAPPTITNGAQYMAATLYTGNGATQSIANSANNTIGTTFQPDLVWIKNRGAIASHSLLDVIRGTNSYLYSDLTNAQGSGESFSSFNANGFSLSGTNARQNANANTYVAWQWKASGTTSSNTNGSITSTVSVNATAGFSVVTYTATAADPITVGHGLGVAPSMFFVKSRSAAGTDWFFYHSSLGATKNLRLNTTAAAATATNVWNDTAPTSTVITTSNAINTNTQTYVAYCFAAVAGYSAFGSYTGNGSTDGPFVYLGFRPRWFLAKLTSSAGGSWHLIDTSRSSTNQVGLGLYPNLSSAESSDFASDILSNGLKIRNTQTELNASGATYIYAAFAENPFTIARAR